MGSRRCFRTVRELFILPLLIIGVATAIFPAAARPAASDAAKKEGFDGPAELPRVYVHSALADTPAPGRVHEIHQGDDLQKAIDDAKCGDTLALQAGATFSGLFRLPKKTCDDSHWIILRTSAPDNGLPPEGARITPCYAGVASLPGRPDFHCPSPKNVLARVIFDGKGESGPILISSGANHYRLIGLEITRSRPEAHLRHLIATDDAASNADHLVFDRIWLHGTPTDETKDGLHLSGVTFAAIVDSYVNDLHCIAGKGSCTDAQAVNGGTGDLPGGPYKIVNNFLEASGENILFGGAAATTQPADIEIRHNHFFKPLLWKRDQPGFVASYTGNPYIVKNHFELKNAQRVLLEGNLLENSWGGFSQAGFSLVISPANQGGNCPACQVSDVTIRYNKVSHVGGGLELAAALSTVARAASSGSQRYSIHDLVVDDIDHDKYEGFGLFALILSQHPPIRDVRVDHVTAFSTRTLLSILNHGSKLENFTITNNLFSTGGRRIVSAGGGATNCTRGRDTPAEALNNCFVNPVFTKNLIIGGGTGWPPDNFVVNDSMMAGIRDFHEGNGGNYRLCDEAKDGCKKRSLGLKAGTDGKDIGADIEAVDEATRGAE